MNSTARMPTGAEAREQVRIELRFRVVAVVEGTDHECLSLDLSTGGACLSAVDRFMLDVGDEIPLRVFPDRSGPGFELHGEIRWLAASPSSLLFGIKFLGDDIQTTMASNIERWSEHGTETGSLEIPTFDVEESIEFRGTVGRGPNLEQLAVAVLGDLDESLDDFDIDPAGRTARAWILLNPAGSTPLGLNLDLGHADLPPDAAAQIRSVVAHLRYPAFAGPPAILPLEFAIATASDVDDDFDDDFDDL